MYVYYGDDGVVIYTVNCKPKLAPAGNKIEVPAGTVVIPGSDKVVDGAHVPSTPDPDADLANERSAMSLTFAQLLIGLVTEEWITEQEGDSWLAGNLPKSVKDLIATLPKEQRFAAKARAARPSVILRTDPLVKALASENHKTPEELDTFFTTYAEV